MNIELIGIGGTQRGFLGDASALDEFKIWFFSLQPAEGERVEEETSDSDGGVGQDGLRVGDDETEDRYADREMDETDGGVQLRWY